MTEQEYKALRSASGVKAWQARCALTHNEAAKALHLPIRTWFRWCSRGLPTGSQGRITADVMQAIEKRTKKKKT